MDDLEQLMSQSYDQENYDVVALCAQRLLEQNPRHYLALLMLGNLAYLDHDYLKAAGYYEASLHINKNEVAPAVNLANTYNLLKKYRKALKICHKILAKDSLNADALTAKGTAEMESGKYKDSIATFKQALHSDNHNPWLHNYLGQVYQKEGCYSQALASAWQAVELSKGEDSQQINFAYTLYEIALEKDISFIRPHLQKWRRKYPKHPVVVYVCAALNSDAYFTQADPEYIRGIFDAYADSFEDSLSGLSYCVPQLIASTSQQIVSADYTHKKKAFTITPLHVLDLGCGTGLCGYYLNNKLYNLEMTGVDLSSEMLAQAKKKQLYQQLYCSDILQFFDQQNNPYDLIVAADVFTYFGKLEAVFNAVSQHIKKDGFFIFSITQNLLNDSDYFLHISGRFSHSQNYIKKLLRLNGFLLLNLMDSELRKEGDKSVRGWIFSAQKI